MKRKSMLAGLALMAGMARAGDLNAQVGAIGSAPGGSASGAQATSRAPLFGESGLVMPRGSWSLGAYGGYTSGSLDLVITEVDFSFTQILVGGFYAISDRATLGAILFPYNSVSFDTELGSGDESGMGDAQLYGKYQLVNANDGNTTLAGIVNVSLPTGDDDFGANGTTFAVRGALSHSLQRLTLHGNFGVAVPTDDEDGETTLLFGGAAMLAASPAVGVGAELLGSSFSAGDERFTTIDLAPTVRFRVGQRAFIDAGAVFNVSSSFDPNPFDYALVFGFTYSR